MVRTLPSRGWIEDSKSLLKEQHGSVDFFYLIVLDKGSRDVVLIISLSGFTKEKEVWGGGELYLGI